MRAEINKKGQLSIFCEDYDLCHKCKNVEKCPLIQAISQEIVILHYSDIAIGECGMYQKGK
jgi:hypothetical protein